jgi:hypothetical protein
VKRCLDEGADPDSQAADDGYRYGGRTALRNAAGGNHIGCMELLVAAGATVDKANEISGRRL